jgi:hypothetical protein
MSKRAATTVSFSRMSVGWFCAAWSAMTLMAPTALAATADPKLQRSEQMDMRRLGKVPDDERSVLRVEWHASVQAGEERRAVQEMLDSLRRMQGTVDEISRLIRDIPPQKSMAAAATMEASESHFDGKTLALAGSAVIGLLAFWWFRRRDLAAPSGAPPISEVPPEAGPPVVAETPGTRSPTAPAPVARTILKPAEIPTQRQSGPSVPPHKGDGGSIDYSMEEADPESIARESEKLEKLQALDRRKAPERKNNSNIEPTLELAGIMLSLGLEQGAAQTLVEYIDANPRQALHHSFKLLEIYRDSGHRKDFKEAAEKLRQNFNIQAEDWMRESVAEAPTLEGFSRLSQHIQEIWSRPTECINYLQNLLEDNREGARAGFPWPVAEEILLLIDILKETSGAPQTVGV